MFNDLKEHLSDDNCFGNCKECNDRTSVHKLEEFNGMCEECYYKDEK